MLREPQIMTFGDGRDVLGLIGSGPTGPGAGLPVLSLGAFRVPERERITDFWAFKRKVQGQVVDEVVGLEGDLEHGLTVLVIAIDATGRRRRDTITALCEDLTVEAAHTASLVTGRRLLVVSVIIRAHEERELLADSLAQGRFEHVVGSGWMVIEGEHLGCAPL